MLKSHERFHSANGKRTILVVDDELINRELLGVILGSEYEVLFAENGQQGFDIIQERINTLSLVLLDLIMPVMSGTELLRRVKEDAETAKIPVIVLTSDQTAEVECLEQGAIDFIPKPYPHAGVILARIRRTIELSEDRDIIQSTERDPLTGLYNREYFYRYAQQFDQYHADTDMDAIVVDIYHFRTINERFGTAYGDGVLLRVGEKLRQLVQESGGLVCRREADTFLVYCPHRTDYEAILNGASVGLAEGGARESRVRLRMGVYSVVDKSIDMERRFDRAKNAADTVRTSVTKTVAIYDNALHEKELYDEQLVEDFHKAIAEEQFKVYYQPKFDVRPKVPLLTSAEALVRWVHPDLGMISPGVFIPLFEQNGLIRELDHYVWRHVAAQIRDWKARFGFVAPVSVNVSRIDMYDPLLVETFRQLLEEYDLRPRELLLEITESAYTQESAQIIRVVNALRALGFRIEMDDFGTGYSSLNMISSLPIDALKLDMQFIRSAFSQRKDTRMLEVIIEIADYLGVPVIAEGVETEEQLLALKAMGCDIVQGYYFSRPLPAGEYERFLEERMQRDRETEGSHHAPARSLDDSLGAELGRIAQALAADYFSIYYVNTRTDHFIEYRAHTNCRELNIQQSGEHFFDLTQENVLRVVCPEDQQRVRSAMEKETILAMLEKSGMFTLTYRLMIEGKPTYVHLKAIQMGNTADPHIVIGVSSIDEQVRRDMEHEKELASAREAANRDALTGVKSKFAFVQAEETWNASIQDASARPFAVTVCDVNGLKHVNDTLGHKAGDEHIRKACQIVCNVFKHSPVYRVGGDEFVAILSGSDYERRQDLMRILQNNNEESLQNGGVIIACGMADYDADADGKFEQVFERADQQMYQNKTALKARQ